MASEAEVVQQARSPALTGMVCAIRGFVKEKPLGAAGGFIFIIIVLVAILAPWIIPKDPLSIDLSVRLSQPSLSYLMGTDELGRDILSRIIYGARMSTLVGITTVLLGTSVGALIGVVSGYLGGRVDMYVQRIMDMMMAFPSLIMAIAIMAALGPSITNVIIAIAIPNIPRTNRVVRSVAMSVKGFQYVEAVKAVGAKQVRIIFRHILPNCLASYLIVATAMLGNAILIEASLSFLGLGVPPPFPSWGRSLCEAMGYYYVAPWLAVFPGLAISLIVFAANIMGDAIRDFWDPRLKRL